MKTYNGNGSSGNRHALARTPELVGRSVVHKRYGKRALACLAANWLDGEVNFKPTARQAAAMFGVSLPYIRGARELSPECRAAIVNGRDSVTLVATPTPKVPGLPLNGTISDEVLEHAVRTAGVERTLSIAAKIDAAAAHHTA